MDQFSTAERIIMENSMGDPHETKNRMSIIQQSHSLLVYSQGKQLTQRESIIRALKILKVRT